MYVVYIVYMYVHMYECACMLVVCVDVHDVGVHMIVRAGACMRVLGCVYVHATNVYVWMSGCVRVSLYACTDGVHLYVHV